MASSTTASVTAGLSPSLEAVEGEFMTMKEKFEQRSSVRQTAIKWESVASLASLPHDEVHVLNSLERMSDPIEIGTYITSDRNCETAAVALVKVLSKVNQEGHIRKALLFLHDALHIPGSYDGGKSMEFLRLMIEFEVEFAEREGRDPYGDLLKKHTESSDRLTLELSCGLLGLFLRTDRVPRTKIAESFMRRMNDFLRGSDVSRIEVAGLALSNMLRCDASDVYKHVFFNMQGYDTLIKGLSKAYQASQATYYLLFCIWLLSYSLEFVRAWQGEYHLVAIMHDYLRKSKKEKVVRMALYVLLNVTKHGLQGNEYFDFLMDMITLGVDLTLEKLQRREFSDADIKEALAPLRQAMEHDHPILTSFDDYRQEVLSGHLENSHCHKNEKFWRQNINKFEENDGVILLELRGLLSPERDTQTLVLACQDVGSFVRFHPRGRKIMEDFGFKPFVLKLLNHEEEEVGKAALECMQKLLIKNWEFLSRE